jgi:hypothetical protein
VCSRFFNAALVGPERKQGAPDSSTQIKSAMSDLKINYRGLAESKEIATQNGVTLVVRHEAHWQPGSMERKNHSFLSIKGQGSRLGTPVAVEWMLPVTDQLPAQIDAFLNQVELTRQSRELLREYSEVGISCEPTEWLTLGWLSSDSGSPAYATFRRADTLITARFAHHDSLAMIRNALG